MSQFSHSVYSQTVPQPAYDDAQAYLYQWLFLPDWLKKEQQATQDAASQ